MFDALRRYVRNQMFHPGWLGLLVNPFFFARRGLSLHTRMLAPRISGRVLDVGCGQVPYRSFFTSAVEYTGMEIDTSDARETKKADMFYDGRTFPCEDETFDAVVFFQVLEHVFNPGRFLDETARVLRNDGLILLTVPFVWDEHEQPFDYGRYSSFGLRYLLETHGFEVIEHHKSVADVRVVFQLINAYIFKKTVTRNSYINALVTLLLMAPFNVAGSILGAILPGNNDLYLDNVVLARRHHHDQR